MKSTGHSTGVLQLPPASPCSRYVTQTRVKEEDTVGLLSLLGVSETHTIGSYRDYGEHSGREDSTHTRLHSIPSPWQQGMTTSGAPGQHCRLSGVPTSLDTPAKSCHNGAQERGILEDHELATHRYGMRLAGVRMGTIPCIPRLDCPRAERKEITMANTIRTGIVGATVTQGGSGWGANAHVPALCLLPHYALLAVCT